MRPLISLIIPARNDNYMGNSNWRLQTTLNYNAMVFERTGRLSDLEQVVVDWGSPSPLHQALELTDQARQVTRFIIVPLSVADAVRGDSDFPDSIALNVGFRRASGTYLAQTGADVLWPEDFLKVLLNILDRRVGFRTPVDKTLFIFDRKHVPWDLVASSPDIAAINRYITENGKILPLDPLLPFLLAPGGSVLMHRDLWMACRAYDERLIYWGWNDINLSMRIRLKFHCADMGKDMGLHVYHLQHYAPGKPPPPRAQRLNPFIFSSFTVNEENWGLADHIFEEHPAPRHPLEVDMTRTSDVQPTPASFRRRHAINLLAYCLTHPTLKTMRLAYFVSIVMLADCPEGSRGSKAYRFFKNIKTSYLNRLIERTKKH